MLIGLFAQAVATMMPGASADGIAHANAESQCAFETHRSVCLQTWEDARQELLKTWARPDLPPAIREAIETSIRRWTPEGSTNWPLVLRDVAEMIADDKTARAEARVIIPPMPGILDDEQNRKNATAACGADAMCRDDWLEARLAIAKGWSSRKLTPALRESMAKAIVAATKGGVTNWPNARNRFADNFRNYQPRDTGFTASCRMDADTYSFGGHTTTVATLHCD